MTTKSSKLVGSFAKTLLGATCLTAATGGAAVAGTITYTEGTNPATPVTWPSTSLGVSLVAATLPGTTVVNAFAPEASQVWFELTGLGTGTFTLSANETSDENFAITVFNDSLTKLEGGGSQQTNGPGDFGPSFTDPLNFSALAIPSDGNLVIEVTDYHEDSGNFTVTVNTTASGVPEPGTLGMVGLGLAGALAARRRLKK